MKNLVNFKNKKILIFGASSGIGRQTAIRLSELGANLIIVARREEELLKTAELCEGTDHGIYPFDVTQIDDIGGLIKNIVDEKGPLDGMVYSVGISNDVPVTSLNYKRLYNTFESNYFAFVECVRQTAKRNRYNEGFRIVAVSSVSSLQGEKSHCAYAGSKAAMDGSVRVMAKELAAKGICINTVAPGITKTEMSGKILEFMESGGDSFERIEQRQYLGMIEPGDVANAVCFLLSSAARMITGITLPVDGGFTSSC